MGIKDMYWGVDSAQKVNSKVNHKGQTLYEYISEYCENEPEFWGRYIGGNYALTKAEVDYIFEKSDGACRILVIYNGAHNSSHSVGGNQRAGVEDAHKAIKAATALNIPRGVMIYADIEPNWKCTAEWFHGWWKAMFDSPYGGMGGVYENPLKWNAPNFANPYLKALKGDSPFIFEDPPSKARYLYSQQPCKGCLKPKSITFDFVPAEPHGVRGTTVVWQYGIDCVKRGGTHGLIDMDLADARGYASMWHAPEWI